MPGLLDFMQVGHIDVLQWVDSQSYIIKGCARSAQIPADLAHLCPIAVWGCVFGRLVWRYVLVSIVLRVLFWVHSVVTGKVSAPSGGQLVLLVGIVKLIFLV